MEFEDIIETIGGYGIFQRLIIWLFYFPMCILSGMGSMNTVFMINTPDFWCNFPDLVKSNLSQELRKNLSLTRNGGTTNPQCETSFNSESSLAKDGYNVTRVCNHGFEFNLLQFGRTVITDWELVCLNTSWPLDNLILMVTNLGGLIGSLIFGYTLDKYGRKNTLLICIFIEILFGAISAAAPEIISFTIFRFIMTFGLIIIVQGATTLGIEWVPPSQRMFVACGTNCFYATGIIMAVAIASAMNNWKYYALATSLPFVVFLILYWFSPESSQWLLSQNRCVEAEDLLRKAAKFNKKTFSENLSSALKALADRQKEETLTDTQSANIGDLFRTPNMRKKSTIICLMWFIFGLDYLGLSYYALDLAGNIYTNFILSASIEIPAYIVAWPVVDYFGRKWPITIFMTVGGLACLIMTAFDAEMKTPRLVIFLIGKFFVSASTVMGFPFTGELTPTALRGGISGLASVFIFVGYILSPIIEGLEKKYPGVPLYIFGGLAFVSGFTILFLPETLNNPLPQTILDGENFGKNMTFKEMMGCCSSKSQSETPKKSLDYINGDMTTIHL